MAIEMATLAQGVLMGSVESYEEYIPILVWDVLRDYPRRSEV